MVTGGRASCAAQRTLLSLQQQEQSRASLALPRADLHRQSSAPPAPLLARTSTLASILYKFSLVHSLFTISYWSQLGYGNQLLALLWCNVSPGDTSARCLPATKPGGGKTPALPVTLLVLRRTIGGWQGSGRRPQRGSRRGAAGSRLPSRSPFGGEQDGDGEGWAGELTELDHVGAASLANRSESVTAAFLEPEGTRFDLTHLLHHCHAQTSTSGPPCTNTLLASAA